MDKVIQENQWSRSQRILRDRVLRKNGGFFWDLVSHNAVIDLKQFNLPGVQSVKFEFIDPIWEYITRCQELNELGVQFEWH